MTARNGSIKQAKSAIFPVAGLGTCLLSATKAGPNVMTAVEDKPLIQYAVEEAVPAGITEVIYVIGRAKQAIEDHFDKAHESENELAFKDRTEMLKSVLQIVPQHGNCIYIRQAVPLHAAGCAGQVVNDELFAVIPADGLIDADPPAIMQMMDVCPHLAEARLNAIDVLPRHARDKGRCINVMAHGVSWLWLRWER